MLSNIRAFMTWMCLSAYLLVGLGSINMAVVCFGTDGHIAIEAASDYCCDQSPDGSQHINSSSTMKVSLALAVNYCGPCVDLPFSAGNPDRQFVPTQDTSSQARLLYLPSFAGAVSMFSEFTADGILPLSSLKTDLTPIFLRTTILLI